MTITMNDSHMITIDQIREFAKLDMSPKLGFPSKKEKYKWINAVLIRFRYRSLKKNDKGVVRKYIQKMTSLSDSQITKIIYRKKNKKASSSKKKRRNSFVKKYGAEDISLLVKTDNLHGRISGPATQGILVREFEVFGRSKYSNISQVSISHIYNLRKTRQYESHSLTVNKTCSVSIPIGERRKPEPYGKPGYLRVDSVHQGDKDKEKGVYHINIVDEVTQWEIVGTVERISEAYLAPLLESLLEMFPFTVINFHSDNGSEYINKIIAKLLNKLMISQTKSRARHTNDNALVESKNRSSIRKHIGYAHIPKKFAKELNAFCKDYLNPYLNYHHPCGFATTYTDKKGKERKKYDTYMTPYQKFKSIPNCEQYLKPGVTIASLDEIAYSMSDNEFAEKMQKAKKNLFKNFKHVSQEMLTFTSFVSCSLLD